MSSEEFEKAASPYTKLLAEQRLTNDLLSKGIDKDGVAFSEKIYIIEKCRKAKDEESRKKSGKRALIALSLTVIALVYEINRTNSLTLDGLYDITNIISAFYHEI